MREQGFKSMVRRIAAMTMKDIATSTLSGLVRVGAAFAFIAVCKHLIDIATGNSDGSILLYAGLMLGCVAVQLCFGTISTLIENRSEITMRNKLRSILFMHIIKGDWIAVSEYHSGDLVSRLNDDVATITNMICRDIPYALITTAQLAGAIIFLLCLDIRLCTLIVVIMPIAIIASRFYARRMRSITSQLRSAESRLSVSVQEWIRNRILVKTLSGYDFATEEHVSLSGNIRKHTMRRTRMSLYSKCFIQGGFACGYAAAFLFGIYGLKNQLITFGMMTAFLQLVSQVQRPTLELSKIIPSMIRTMTATERIAALLDIPQESDGSRLIINGKIGVRFRHVSFKYPKADYFAINDLSCDFSSGVLTAVVGKSGAGKTTLFRMLLGLIAPSSGELVIYNEMFEYKISEATRANFSYVPQGNSLVCGSIRDNLLLGNPSADGQIISEALETACANFVYDLPDGLDFRCEEDGVGLSEGQAQRIAIARGLIHPSRILLLDEPTSALDFSTSVKLLENLSNLQSGKTIIIITHSPEVANLCQFKINLS